MKNQVFAIIHREAPDKGRWEVLNSGEWIVLFFLFLQVFSAFSC